MILIVGAGFLGAYLLKYLTSVGEGPVLAVVRDTANAVPFPGVEYVKCDITCPADVSMLAKRCGKEKLTVFYFAACHNVDYLYTHVEEGWRINVDALSFFLDAVPGIEKLFFASTDCVYGENPPHIPKFKETHACHPVNVYGYQKLAAEKNVLQHGFTAVRFSYMLGPSPLKKRHFYDVIAQRLLAGTPVEMIDGMVRSALSYETAAALLGQLARQPAGSVSGIFNLCSDGEYTKYDLGLRIADAVHAPRALVKKIPEDAAAAFFQDRRASRSIMDNTKLKSLLAIESIELEV